MGWLNRTFGSLDGISRQRRTSFKASMHISLGFRRRSRSTAALHNRRSSQSPLFRAAFYFLEHPNASTEIIADAFTGAGRSAGQKTASPRRIARRDTTHTPDALA